ncbi:26S proteasome non-ATPase regulatory subunit 4-like [Artemia franciscana]|uniref:26S proteasome non-ATPase regulatory subunit 4 n=1 Tax=Artemia franciscana TaxID=6661 RepID=A0AA88IH04_ARTSF|nr:hypothetical protein QYM36_007472 [Artemia franciscana]
MVLESTMICVDNSEYMRNGDFIPTRLQAQEDGVNIVCHAKTRSNPENNVGLLTLANTEVLVTLTTDSGRILGKLHQVQPKGEVDFLSGIKIAHLALKHRQGKNHRMRIVVFVGSPVGIDEKELVKTAKKLRKEKVNVDIINFGEEEVNTGPMTTFINALNGKDGTGSHLVTIPPGPHLSDALISSPVVQGEDGAGIPGLGGPGFEFGFDASEDPELALALRVSMEEQRQRQEEEERRAQVESAQGGEKTTTAMETESTEGKPTPVVPVQARPEPNFASMTEEEQLEYALRMSMQDSATAPVKAAETMEIDPEAVKKEENDTLAAMMQDPEFIQNVLGTLPGVDQSSDIVRTAVEQIKKESEVKDKKKENK